jgi:myo-inositol-1(or 4)-monophosphatase
MDLDALVGEASAILDASVPTFLTGRRADSAVAKKGNDFATEIDLAIERQVVAALQDATGIGVHGEEFGGSDLDSPWVWVLDPIDGTFNYAAGSPMAAILLGLLHDSDALVGVGTFTADARGRFPGRYRLAVLENLSRVSSRLRMHGSAGIDLVYVADGILGGAISFGGHVWDHAAGVALVRAAGGIVTNLDGGPWTRESRSALAAAPGAHGEILEILHATGKPEDY